MDAQMKINGDMVRALREQKSWSQEHLANASGLSVRTVQRVEVEGIGSAETRLALAAALGISVAELVWQAPLSTHPTSAARGLPLWAWLGWGVGVIVCMGVVSYGYSEGAFPLNRIAANLLPSLAFLGISVGLWGTWSRRRGKRR